MEQGRRSILIWRWALVTSVFAALFWTVWGLVMGEVPAITSLRITPDRTLEFPFAVSRWWDVLAAPL